MVTKAKKPATKPVDQFSKSSLVKSSGFKPIERDILSIKLDENKQYTVSEAKKIIGNFKGGI